MHLPRGILRGRVRDALVLSAALVTLSSVYAVSAATSSRRARAHHPARTHHAARPRPVIGMPTPAAGFVRGHVTVVGDSVLIDAAGVLQHDVPGASILATVGEQFASGVAELGALRARDALGAVVVVALGTNGPVTPALMRSLLTTVAGASRLVLVTNHVDRPWERPNDVLIRRTARGHRHIVVADWQARAVRHPGWFYADGTHLPIGGRGAHELAWIIRQAIHRP